MTQHNELFHIIEDNRYHLDVISEEVHVAGYDVKIFETAEHYEHYLTYNNAPEFKLPTAVLSHAHLSTIQGKPLSIAIHNNKYPHLPVVLIVNDINKKNFHRVNDGPCLMFEMPYQSEELEGLLSTLVACHERRASNRKGTRVQSTWLL